jgi:hypothetical protein
MVPPRTGDCSSPSFSSQQPSWSLFPLGGDRGGARIGISDPPQPVFRSILSRKLRRILSWAPGPCLCLERHTTGARLVVLTSDRRELPGEWPGLTGVVRQHDENHELDRLLPPATGPLSAGRGYQRLNDLGAPELTVAQVKIEDCAWLSVRSRQRTHAWSAHRKGGSDAPALLASGADA